MSALPEITFAKTLPEGGTLVVLVDDTLALGAAARAAGVGPLVERAARIAEFKGKGLAVLDLIAPADVARDRVLVVGLGKTAELARRDYARLGGTIAGALRKGETASLIAEWPDGTALSPDQIAELALGARLRAYGFDRYKSATGAKREAEAAKGAEEPAAKKAFALTLVTAETGKAKKAWSEAAGLAAGIELARDLVNEPPNVLGPVELAERAEALASLGVEIEVLDEKKMKKLGMRALLGVAQGSARPPRLVAMRWNGLGKTKGKDAPGPVAFVGKGVVFDTGGISIKPAGGMEDMKGDMGGAAAVIGLMHALASRQAKADVVGVVGIVENMPDGAAQRPGDIVTAASGTTIEIINTDAEGRLVLADALWWTVEEYKPRAIVDLATLTGAIIVALGHHNAGLFSNDDALAAALSAAGEATGEPVWRMPLGPAYDKQIESKFADIKNTGGRDGGSATAAAFLKRFVPEGTPWAHLDIAGTAMGSAQNEINRSWASGWGVRLLDRLVAERYEG